MSTDPNATTASPPPAPGPPPAAEPKPSLTESRPEILVGAAAAGGFLLAKLLGRIRG